VFNLDYSKKPKFQQAGKYPADFFRKPLLSCGLNNPDSCKRDQNLSKSLPFALRYGKMKSRNNRYMK